MKFRSANKKFAVRLRHRNYVQNLRDPGNAIKIARRVSLIFIIVFESSGVQDFRASVKTTPAQNQLSDLNQS